MERIRNKINNMKRKNIIGGITFIGFTIFWIIFIGYWINNNYYDNKPLEGIPHNYYHPDVWDKDTVSDEYEKMWITGDGDTIWE